MITALLILLGALSFLVFMFALMDGAFNKKNISKYWESKLQPFRLHVKYYGPYEDDSFGSEFFFYIKEEYCSIDLNKKIEKQLKQKLKFDIRVSCDRQNIGDGIFWGAVGKVEIEPLKIYYSIERSKIHKEIIENQLQPIIEKQKEFIEELEKESK